ncbi:MAG TPA: chemotaxis protein CheX [Nocardioides sp.]|nr:chemotaxis protein CheX [Nocardioides sp.]
MTAQEIAYDAPAFDDLLWVADEVWQALLGEEEVLAPRPVPPGTPFDAPGTWSAAVSVSGGWQGTVTVELSADVAAALTAQMLALPAGEDAADADVADAVGELVNMIGGNVKSLMPGPSVLSLPMVAAGRAAHSSELAEVVRFDACWRDQPLRFSVHVPNH